MHFRKMVLLFLLSLVSCLLFAQADTISLVCPLENGTLRIIRASDRDYQKSSEYGVMLTSKTDTTVYAVHTAQVVLVAKTEDTKYDIVLLYKNYYFWYAGVLSPRVKVNARIKAGDIIGTFNPGDLLELLMFEREEPVNPRQFLKCK
jgi:hypothetical protein